MRALSQSAVAALALSAGFVAFGCTSEPQGEVKLTAIKLKAFPKVLESHRGKVILVDLWSQT